MNLPSSPLVSVIIRSMDRPELAEALASVALSSWAMRETVVVNACGGRHSALPEMPGVRLCNQDGPALPRAAAANLGIVEARGDFLVFLDDDDLLDPPHLEKLASALLANPQAPAAYTGVRLLDGDNRVVREINTHWEPDRLQGMNFLPIHAVMFRRPPAHVRFDDSLAVLEDWDFWIQLSRLGDFINLPGCSAAYRMALGQSGLSSERDLHTFRQAHAQVIGKWAALGQDCPASAALIWFSTAVDQLSNEIARLQDELDQARRAHFAAEHRYTDVINSTSWKVTAPLRDGKAWLEKLRKKTP